MKIAIIGYGKEGKANEAYFTKQGLAEAESAKGSEIDEQGSSGAGDALANEIEVIEEYRDEDYAKNDWGQYDLILRSPSVRPQPEFSSATQYFFDHCPAPIIGVTGTKGKGTTCSMIAAILEALGEKVFLVGNIGIPAISKLTEIQKEVAKEDSAPDSLDKQHKCVVVYELSSFQLWNLTKSPQIAVVLRIAPDHLNVHKDFAEYVAAKGHIAEFQGKDDTVIYFRDNEWSREIAEKSPGRKIPYPIEDVDASTNLTGVNEPKKMATGVAEAKTKDVDASTKLTGVDKKALTGAHREDVTDGTEDVDASTILTEALRERMDELLDNLTVPGQHNREDAEAAVLAVAAYLGEEPELLIRQHYDELAGALKNYQGLPHHIEKVRELNGVTYYDDSFSTAEPALEVAIKAFLGQPLVLIAGGQDKGVDLSETKRIIFGAKNLEKAFLIGEIAEKLAEGELEEKYEVVRTLEEAVKGAQKVAEQIANKEGQVLTEKQLEEKHREQGPVEKGPVVLLSPGAASLDMFESYYARGDEFQKLVKELK